MASGTSPHTLETAATRTRASTLNRVHKPLEFVASHAAAFHQSRRQRVDFAFVLSQYPSQALGQEDFQLAAEALAPMAQVRACRATEQRWRSCPFRIQSLWILIEQRGHNCRRFVHSPPREDALMLLDRRELTVLRGSADHLGRIGRRDGGPAWRGAGAALRHRASRRGFCPPGQGKR
jgi:hypothetical protein